MKITITRAKRMHGCLVPYYLVVDFDVQRFRQLLKDANPRATSLAANGGGIIDIFTQFCYNDINKSVFWLSVLLSLTIECRTQLRPKRFQVAVGTSSARPVRHRRTICRRQICHGCHNISVCIVCSRKRCLLRKRGRAVLVPTVYLLSYADNQYRDLSKT